jgi:hypothetical protein
MCIHICTCICIHIYIYAYTCIYTHISIPFLIAIADTASTNSILGFLRILCIYIYRSMCTYILGWYRYIFIFIYVFTYIYISIHINRYLIPIWKILGCLRILCVRAVMALRGGGRILISTVVRTYRIDKYICICMCVYMYAYMHIHTCVYI